jgi:hypothetical protein
MGIWESTPAPFPAGDGVRHRGSACRGHRQHKPRRDYHKRLRERDRLRRSR